MKFNTEIFNINYCIHTNICENAPHLLFRAKLPLENTLHCDKIKQ